MQKSNSSDDLELLKFTRTSCRNGAKVLLSQLLCVKSKQMLSAARLLLLSIRLQIMQKPDNTEARFTLGFSSGKDDPALMGRIEKDISDAVTQQQESTPFYGKFEQNIIESKHRSSKSGS